ncbi:hypothetical protein WUBG_13035 [Wuchereria bancrofti]|uniref:Uncharacterized protein n=1 Tax=Wuchereria bancrofti TaxID=6293 RepID=J9E1J6_WUCBA|nr:hypothetical protein WUBG_13035 [Wuchereria bancrofti]
MVGWQLRLTPKQAAAKIVVAVVGLAIGAYGVATVYEPLQGLQDELDLRKGELLRYYKTKHDERIRQAFYKRHDMAPNFSKVFDLRSSLSAHGIICSKFEPVVAPSDIMLEKLGLRPVSEWTASTITHRPGMVMLNGIFKSISHLQWIKRSLFIYAESPGFTNVGLQVPNVRNVFKEYGRQLRWSTLGLHYDWATKIYPLEGMHFSVSLILKERLDYEECCVLVGLQIDEKLETRESETSATDDTVLSWPRTIFNLPHTSGAIDH